MIRLFIGISVFTNNQEIAPNLLFVDKLQYLLSCNSAYGLPLNIEQITQILIAIDEGFESEIHFHFRLSFNSLRTYSWWCITRNSFMLSKIVRKVISDTIIHISM